MTVKTYHPDQNLALAYAASPTNRRVLATVFAFDAHMARQCALAREPLFGQLRLAWWRDQFDGATASDPMLVAIRALPEGALRSGTWLAIIDAWEASLIMDRDDVVAAQRFAGQRGRAVFGAVDEADEAMLALGEGWALADLAFEAPEVPFTPQLVEAAASKLIGLRNVTRLPETRALRVLALLAQRDVKGGYPRKTSLGSPRRIWWALRDALAQR